MPYEEVLGVAYDTEDRVIFLTGDFNERNTREMIIALHSMEKLEDRVALEDKAPVNLYITSNGGDLDCFIAIYDIIRLMECKVNTIALGRAYSAGCFLLLSGTGNRMATKNSWVMLHELSAGNWGKLTDLDIHHEMCLKSQEVINKIVAEHTGQSIEKVKEDMKRDLWMTAEEALTYGIVDEII